MPIDSLASLDRHPNKSNWVEDSGGLPQYILRISNHLHQEKGMDIGHAIAVAVNVVKKMCATGDLNWKGIQQANPASRAEACAAVADWERKKAQARVTKSLVRGRKLTDKEYINMLVEKNQPVGVMSDADFDEIMADEDFSVSKIDVEFDLVGEISKADDDKQLVFGWMSVATRANGEQVIDKQGDVLDDIDAMESVAYDFVLNSRDGGEMHIRKGVSTLVESFVSTPEKWKAMKIPEGVLPIGWWGGFHVDDPEVWKGVKSGKYKMFSVHGSGRRTPMTVEETV